MRLPAARSFCRKNRGVHSEVPDNLGFPNLCFRCCQNDTGNNQAQRTCVRLLVPPELTEARVHRSRKCTSASRRTAARAVMRANRKFHDMQESHKLDRDACFGMRVSSVSRHESLVHDRAMLCNQVLAAQPSMTIMLHCFIRTI